MLFNTPYASVSNVLSNQRDKSPLAPVFVLDEPLPRCRPADVGYARRGRCLGRYDSTGQPLRPA